MGSRSRIPAFPAVAGCADPCRRRHSKARGGLLDGCHGASRSIRQARQPAQSQDHQGHLVLDVQQRLAEWWLRNQCRARSNYSPTISKPEIGVVGLLAQANTRRSTGNNAPHRRFVYSPRSCRLEGLAFKRAQRQTDTCHDGVPRPLFVLRVGEIKAVDGAAGKIATTVQYYTFSF